MRATRWVPFLVLLLVGLIASPATAGVSYRGTFAGTTSQGKDITFKVNRRNHVTYLQFGWSASAGGCTVDDATVTSPNVDKRIRDNGRFKIVGTGNPAYTLRGHFETRRRAEGTLHVEFSSPGCPLLVADADWIARKQ